MAKRALLIGCNYPGTNAELRGCINDVWGTQAMLKNHFGFTDADITIMIDTDQKYVQPTGKNIKAKLAEMVQASQDGDILVIHFSGHGTQVPTERPGEEEDNKDEAICPCDMNVITDDDLRLIFQPLQSKGNVKLTFIADCCHSGTLLDHNEVVITGPKPGGPPPPAIDVGAIQSMLASLGAGGNREFKNRALPFDDLLGQLSRLLGQPVARDNVRASMGQLFGADASASVAKYLKYIQMAEKGLNMLSGNKSGAPGGAPAGGAVGGLQGCLRMLTMCLTAAAGPAEGQHGATTLQPGSAGTAAAGAAAGTAAGVVGMKPPANQQLAPDVGILITGCQDKETSADACPSGDPAKAHGALSNALHAVVNAHFAQQPGVPLTYRNMTIAVREALAKSNFAQNPCLECSQKWADAPLITH